MDSEKKYETTVGDTVIDHDTPDAVASAAVDPAVSRRLTRKADLILLPLLAVLYLFNSLDRSNLANAKTSTLVQDLHLIGDQYNQLLTYYYVVFVVFGPPAAMLTKQISAKYSLSIMMFGFGIGTVCTGAVKTFGQLLACRIFVGIFEAGFVASVVYYLSLWYTRKELAGRFALYYAAAVVASAFGGLLAYGVFHIHDAPLFTWAYLFILEGSCTIIMAIIGFFVLPKDTDSAYFLTAEEKEVARLRILADSAETVSSKFSLSESLIEFKSIHVYIRCIIGMGTGIVASSNANFLAIIVAGLGYTTVITNLYTVAPALSAAVILLGFCFSSDYFKERGLHMALALTISFIGSIILICAYPSAPLQQAWLVSNIPNLNARALTAGVVFAVANASGFVSSNIFIAGEAPRYVTALIVNATSAAVVLVVCAMYSLWMRWENKRRDNRDGGERYVTSGIHNTKDPHFRFMP